MKKHSYEAHVNTGIILHRDSKTGLYAIVRDTMQGNKAAYYAAIYVDGRLTAFIWKTPHGLHSVPVVE